MDCENCGEPLACFEGELYCVGCSHWVAVEHLEQATDEALAQIAIDQPEPEVMDWHGQQPPF
jgi:uncharacterized Zn finger protein (UPF0148 family)